jgi:hypothetical protein
VPEHLALLVLLAAALLDVGAAVLRLVHSQQIVRLYNLGLQWHIHL